MTTLKNTPNLNLLGNVNAPIVVVCDAPSEVCFDRGTPMPDGYMRNFLQDAEAAGLKREDFFFMTPCSPLTVQEAKSSVKAQEHLRSIRPEFLKVVSKLTAPKLVLFLGNYAGQQVYGRPVKITKARGVIVEHETFGCAMGLYSPAHVAARPENRDIVRTDLKLAGSLKKAGWSFKKFQSSFKMGKYEWCEDPSFLLKDMPTAIYADTETRGLNWKINPGILCLQMTWEEGQAIAVPMCREYYPGLSAKQHARNLTTLRKLFARPQLHLMGHHFKYDLHMLLNEDIQVANWYVDTLQMAFAVDENMENKAQEACVRRWVPSMAGYSDDFDSKTDKSKMWLVPHDAMLKYGCGDTDSGFRLARVLNKLLAADARNEECFYRVQMPALRNFLKMERVGIRMDIKALREAGTTLSKMESELYDELIKMVPKAVRVKHLEAGLKFSRPDFVRDILFSKEGFNLTPSKYTPSTEDEEDEEDRDASLDGKKHLPLFEEDCEFVSKYLEYSKVQKMRGTYIGAEAKEIAFPIKYLKDGSPPKPVREACDAAGVDFSVFSKRTRLPQRIPIGVKGEKFLVRSPQGPKIIVLEKATGFWQHLTEHGRIHPTIHNHRTVTGRTSTSDPSFQNLPKHHPELAPLYRRTIVPTEGWMLIEADLSQIELRIAAWMAMEKALLAIFRAGGDVHAATAAAVMNISDAKFQLIAEKERDHKRFLAKAVNFGFLFGQWPRGFQQYARTQYKIKITLEEAKIFRDRFFGKYQGLAKWHENMKHFVHKHGFVRALHGALRRLPSIHSQNEGISAGAERQGINSPVQRMASDAALMAFTALGNDCDWDKLRPLAGIHDACVAEAKIVRNNVDQSASAMVWYMENVPFEKWFGIRPPLPIVADVSTGINLDAMKKRKDLKAVRPAWEQYYSKS